MSGLLPSIRQALCDSEDSVRMAAGIAFATLHCTIGKRAIDDHCMSPLLEDLENHQADMQVVDHILAGLREIASVGL